MCYCRRLWNLTCCRFEGKGSTNTSWERHRVSLCCLWRVRCIRWSPYQCHHLGNYKCKIFLCSGKWNIMYKSLKMKKLTSKRLFSIHFYCNGYCTSSGWVLIGTLCPCQEIVGTKKLHYSLQPLPGHWFKVSQSKRSYLSVPSLKLMNVK